MHLGARSQKRLGAGIRARQAKNLMASVDKLWDDGRTDKAGSSGNKIRMFISPSGPLGFALDAPTILTNRS
jgi:hypothetical protein